MSYNNQQYNNQQNDRMKEFAKNEGKKLGKKIGKLVVKKIIGAVGAKAAPILIVIGVFLLLVLAVIGLFYPDVSFSKGKTENSHIKQRLNDYVVLANKISTNVEWLIALDMAIYENNDLLDKNINDNAYHLFGLQYERYEPEKERCRTKEDGTESCRTIPERILERVVAEGKEEIVSFFDRKRVPKDDIASALSQLKNSPGDHVRLFVYGMPLDFARLDAQLDEEQNEYLDNILEIGYVEEMFNEYDVSYLDSSYFSMGTSISCSATKSIDRNTINSILNSAGVFKNHSGTFLTTAEKYGIDPVLFIAIALHETGRGTSNAVVNKKNPGGLMNPSTGSLFVFSSLEEGIDSMGKTLHNRIIKDGLTTISKLGSIYAPVGASNDPNNLNQFWVSNVSNFVNSLGGLTMNCDSYNGGSIAFEGDVSEAAKVIATSGLKWIGNSTYVFGGGRTSGDIARGYFDCSSFVHWAYLQGGINLGSMSSVSTETLNKLGKKISFSEIKVGDLIFWDTYKRDGHVGIYVGNGKFIGAQSSTGVSIVSLSDSYWSSAFNGHVRRLLN